MTYAKFDEAGELMVTKIPAERPHLAEVVARDGFLPYEVEERPDEAAIGAIESYQLLHREEDGRIIGYYEVVAVDQTKVQAEIARLKEELTASDYKVVKNQELQMVGLECEYDPAELHTLREPLREAIRELELYLA